MKPDTSKQWYYSLNGEQQGPVSYDTLKDLAQSGVLQLRISKVWCEGLSEWVGVEHVEGLFEVPVNSSSKDFVVKTVSAGEGNGDFSFGSTAKSAVDMPLDDEADEHVLITSYKISEATFSKLLWPTVVGLVFFIIAFARVSATTAEAYDGFSVAPAVSTIASLVVLFIIGMGFFFWAFVMTIQLIDNMWLIVPPKYARTTPGRALGYLFIPLYNLYWNFQVFPGWAKDYNRYRRSEGFHDAPEVDESSFTAFSILLLCVHLPLLNILAIPLLLVVSFVMFAQVTKVNNFFARYSRINLSC